MGTDQSELSESSIYSIHGIQNLGEEMFSQANTPLVVSELTDDQSDMEYVLRG